MSDIERERVRREARRALLGDRPKPLCVGRFQIIGYLGAGASGVVYDALDTDLHRPVALKVLRRGPGSIPGDDAVRMRREAQALASLDHPNVVRVYEVGEHDNSLYVAMERLDGVPLSDWLARVRDPARIASTLLGAARGLAAAHEKGLLHRDFKPTNVIVDARDRARVIDFGLVLAVGPHIAETPLDRSVTRTGAVIGTPRYMAPEQLRGAAVDVRTDSFAFAVVLYEALFGAHPFGAVDDARALAARIAAGDMETPSETSQTSSALMAVLARALKPSPDDRFASMTALIAAVERALAAPVPGAKIADRYVLRERIGAGGMGVVFRAWDERTRREVALKLVLDENDPRSAERLLREAHATAALRHPSMRA
jgi:serine/threonine protein kinase